MFQLKNVLPAPKEQKWTFTMRIWMDINKLNIIKYHKNINAYYLITGFPQLYDFRIQFNNLSFNLLYSRSYFITNYMNCRQTDLYTRINIFIKKIMITICKYRYNRLNKNLNCFYKNYCSGGGT